MTVLNKIIIKIAFIVYKYIYKINYKLFKYHII